jgi:hypothetical protein
VTLDPKSEAWVQRLVDQAKPLSQRQQDLIAAAFRGALKAPGPTTNSDKSKNLGKAK